MRYIELNRNEPDRGSGRLFIDCKGFEELAEKISKLIKHHERRSGHAQASVAFQGEDKIPVSEVPITILELVRYLQGCCRIEDLDGNMVSVPKLEEAESYQLPQMLYELPARVKKALEYYLLYRVTQLKSLVHDRLAVQILQKGWTRRQKVSVQVVKYLKLPNGQPGEELARETRIAISDGAEGFTFEEILEPRKNHVLLIKWPSGPVFIPAQPKSVVERFFPPKKRKKGN